MKKIIPFFIFLIFSLSISYSQKTYFQQRVDYSIDVRLNDETNLLSGQISMNYVNNSPDTLSFIIFHLWPNAYKNNRTAFSNQFSENGNLSFHFSKKEERGFIDSLNFSINDFNSKWESYAGQTDITKLLLPKPLKPGDSITISTPFRVKIPKSFSRLGQTNQAYQITQWYPKPAVYDRNGWHPMPYLDQGEFYSEFGNFDVKISVPKNYYVAASGMLQNEEEWAFVNERIAFSEKQDFTALSDEDQLNPPSDTVYKTLNFKAENVHDFAWFADKRFYILKDNVLLPSGKVVKTYGYFTNSEADLWAKSAFYTARAVNFYSETVGEYPYPHATAVQSSLGAGGGMEYPMITVIGSSGSEQGLDIVIAHEVGHNWFYGILASDEREHAWMDEGFNSYVESRYSDEYYGENDLRTNYLAYLLQASRGADQSCNTASQKLTNINYFIGAYSKPTLILRYFEQYIGKEKMDELLHLYFEKWKFKHPSPEDLKKVFEGETNLNLNWLFDDLFSSNKKLNYSITTSSKKKNKINIQVRNKGEITAPFSISLLNEEDSLLQKFWFNGLNPGVDTNILLEVLPDLNYRLDASGQSPDIDKNDNRAQTKGIFKAGNPPKLKFLLNTKRPEYPFINFAPLVGLNSHDGFMLGMAFYNLPVPEKKWEYAFAPLYAFRSKTVVGMAEVRRNFIPHNGILQKWSVGMGFKAFNFDDNENFKYHLRFLRFNPNAEFIFRKKEARDYNQHQLKIENLIIGSEYAQFSRLNDSLTIFNSKQNSWRSTHRIIHTFKNSHPIHPFSLQSQLEYANYQGLNNQYQHYLKLSVEGKFKFYYSKKNSVDLRVFAAGFPFHTDRDFGAFPLHLASRNVNDYHFDEHVYGRNESVGFWSQQVNLREGGFKTPIDISQKITDGRSNTFLLALNLKSDLPIKLPVGLSFVKIKPYFDLGFYSNSAPSYYSTNISDFIFFSGGMMLDIWDGAAGLYFPIFNSSLLDKLMKQRGNYLSQISFSFNLNRLKPKEFANEIINNLY